MTWLHNPGCVGEATELFYKDVVVPREDVSLWNDVHVNVATLIVFLCHRVIFSLKVFAVPFDILHHQVFLTQFVTVWEVIKYLEIIESEARVRVENSTFDCPGESPINVPVFLAARSSPASALKISDKNSFFKISAKLELCC